MVQVWHGCAGWAIYGAAASMNVRIHRSRGPSASIESTYSHIHTCSRSGSVRHAIHMARVPIYDSVLNYVSLLQRIRSGSNARWPSSAWSIASNFVLAGRTAINTSAFLVSFMGAITCPPHKHTRAHTATHASNVYRPPSRAPSDVLIDTCHTRAHTHCQLVGWLFGFVHGVHIGPRSTM